MQIIDMADEHERLYCKCLEDWSDEMKEAGDHKTVWLEQKKKQGLRVKLARDDENKIVGMIHYVPIEHAPAIGADLYYVYCVWVHGHKEGVGDNQKKGIGKALLEAAEKDAESLGAKGLVAWGITLPFFMRSKWFKKQGYLLADRDGMMEMVWKPFRDDAVAPVLLRLKKKPTVKEGVITVTCLRNGWCPAQDLSFERMKRASAGFGDLVDFREIDTEEREIMEEWGTSDALFIDDRLIPTGPPPSYAKLRKMLESKARKLRARRSKADAGGAGS